jgi:hypothetical protein
VSDEDPFKLRNQEIPKGSPVYDMDGSTAGYVYDVEAEPDTSYWPSATPPPVAPVSAELANLLDRLVDLLLHAKPTVEAVQAMERAAQRTGQDHDVQARQLEAIQEKLTAAMAERDEYGLRLQLKEQELSRLAVDHANQAAQLRRLAAEGPVVRFFRKLLRE